MVANKKKMQTYKQKQYKKKALTTHYVHSQSITIFTKCIDRIFVFTNKFLTSFFDRLCGRSLIFSSGSKRHLNSLMGTFKPLNNGFEDN